MNISANGFYDHTLSLKAEGDLQAGDIVKLSGNYTVSKAQEGDTVTGIIRSVREGICAVQMKGAVTLSYSGTAPSVGSASLVCDGEGKVCSSAGGTVVTVLAVNETAGTLTCIL